MNNNYRKYIFALTVLAGIVVSGRAQTNVFEIDIDKKGPEIPSTMYGLFFEDINYAADGGLYAEKIKNRSFDFPYAFTGWLPFGNVEIMTDGPFPNNPNYVRIYPATHREKQAGIENEGFFGVSYEKGEKYRFSVYARVPDNGESGFKVQLVDPATSTGTQVMGEAKMKVKGNEWKKYTVEITPSATVEKGKLRILMDKPGNTVDLEHISLFPVDTWQGHENGLRKDLAQKLADIQPGVFRFPGGCIVEGTELDTRYQWKNSVGPVENRPLNENRWNYTFAHHLAPDYFQTYGLGFYEYFLLSEEIGAEPLPVVNVGLACQYQNDDVRAHVPLDSLQPYIDDTLDLIEFANGPVDSEWGSLRASMGHPEPFNLKYVGIGNEQWDSLYTDRLKPFVKAVREKYPDIRIVGSSGPDSEGEQFEFLWDGMKTIGVDLVDEHFYRPESWFLSQGNRYDNYDRKGPKVFAGEYACHGKGKGYNHYNAALMEAAFMTGLERNADIVEMATYAPLFAHAEGWQWRPDMIWFDNLRSMPTASYYVQQLYSTNKGSRVVPLKMNGKPVAGNEGQNGLFATAAQEDPSGDLIVKVVNTGETPQPVEINLKGKKNKKNFTKVKVTTLHSDNPDAENTLENPDLIKPTEKELAVDLHDNWTTILPEKTFAVYRFSK